MDRENEDLEAVNWAMQLSAATAAQRWPLWKSFCLHPQPQRLLTALRQQPVIAHYPELQALIGVKQNPVYHPEGDVWTHTLLVCAYAATHAIARGFSEEKRVRLLLACLCHDIGKAPTTKVTNGKLTSRGHSNVGYDLSKTFLRERLGLGDQETIDAVANLVKDHLFHLDGAAINKKAIGRLQKRLVPATIEELVFLIEADASGRPPLPQGRPANADKMLSLVDDDPAPRAPELISGQDIIDLGVAEGPRCGHYLTLVREKTASGELQSRSQALDYLRSLISSDDKK